MKVIFLDIDGVLVNRDSLRVAGGFRAVGAPSCVEALNKIVEETGAQIVVSSTWRRKFRYSDMCRLLYMWGVTGKVIDCTPFDYKFTMRGQEIAKWLEGEHVDSFIILDDDCDMGDLCNRLVQTCNEKGLTMEDAKEAIARLNQ